MKRAEDFQFCSAARSRNKSHFWGPCSCFECRKHRKNRITPTRTHIPFAAVNMRYESIYRFAHIVTYSSGKVVAKWASVAKDRFGPTVRLRKIAFAGGLLRRERLRLTLGLHDGALAARKPGEASSEDEGE